MKLWNLVFKPWVSLVSFKNQTHPKTHPKFGRFESDSRQTNHLKYPKILVVSLMSLFLTPHVYAHAHAHACLAAEINSRNSSNSPGLDQLIKLTKLTKQKTWKVPA